MLILTMLTVMIVDPGWIHVNCLTPSQRINKMQIWDGLTKLLIVDLGWIHVNPLPPHPHPWWINKMQIWSGLTKLLIVIPGWIRINCLPPTPTPPARSTQNCSHKMIMLSSTVPNFFFFNILMSV